MSLVERKIEIQVALGTGSFGESGQTVVKLTGFRMSCTIIKDGIPSMNVALLRIYGLNQSVMNQLSQLGYVFDFARRNLITITAGDDLSGMSLVFSGGIEAAWEDMTAMPETSFVISARTGYLAQMKTVPPSSFTGPTDVAVIVRGLAQQMGYTYEDNNVHVTLESPYLAGTARAQVLAAAAAADVYVVFEDDGGILTLVPKDGARNLPVPVIQPPPAGSMAGYPNYIGPGLINVRMLYNPQVRFLGNIQIKSSIPKASGLWTVVKLAHELESQLPNGAWFTEVTANMFLPGIQQ